ncbi:MAG: thioredoxin family protein [Candidatus Altiarchaeia archaeon]|jgi:small redox-active disulfide protein 2
MEIKILGTGCPKCHTLDAAVKKAVEELRLKDAAIERVDDIAKIIEYGVMSTPALVVDGEVKFSGRVPNVADIKKILKE